MNVSANSTAKQPFKNYRSQVTFIAQVTSLAVLGVIIVFGNLASIITFVKTQSLRRRSHYLIICLSVADFLVGVVDFMLMYYFLTGPRINTFGYILEFIDTLTGVASILTLSAISVERFSAILFPFRHRMLRFKVYVALSVSPWVVAIVVAVLSLIPHFKRSVYPVFMNTTFVVAALALLIITISYISMGCKMRRQNNPSAQNQNRVLRDRKLVVTLLIVTLSSLVTWLPLQGFVIVNNLCKTCPLPDSNDVFAMKFLQFCNSGLNIFIYIVRMPEFRVAFLALFCRKKERILKRQNNILSKTNTAFAGDETDRVSRDRSAQITEFDDLQDTVHTFNQSMNGIDDQLPSNQDESRSNELNDIQSNTAKNTENMGIPTSPDIRNNTIQWEVADINEQCK